MYCEQTATTIPTGNARPPLAVSGRSAATTSNYAAAAITEQTATATASVYGAPAIAEQTAAATATVGVRRPTIPTKTSAAATAVSDTRAAAGSSCGGVIV